MAHEALDKIGVAGGALALRTLALVGILDGEREKAKQICPCPWHDEAVVRYPNTSHRHAEVMLRVHQDEQVPIIYDENKKEYVYRPFNIDELLYVEHGTYPPGWEVLGGVYRPNPG